MRTKMRPAPLQRAAAVSVRQSPGSQVRHHQASGRRQDGVAERAQDVGVAQGVSIADDVGRSGAGRQERPGVGQRLTAVCAGTRGAVFAVAASRLARHHRDWHHLMARCALTDP